MPSAIVSKGSKGEAGIVQQNRVEKFTVNDVILSNGTLNIGDKFAVVTKTGPSLITIRNLISYSNLLHFGSPKILQ